MQIELEHITKTYDTPVIKDLSYTFEAGKLYVIKGVSGCGKTTLLNLIGGIDSEFDGAIKADREEIKAGYIFQSSLLISGLTVRENLLLIKDAPDEINALSQTFGVDDLLDKHPRQLSGGERQRISMIRALLRSPNLLLADEPTASLDDENSENIAQTIARLRDRDRIIIVATHEHYFDAYADKIIHLRYGVIDDTEDLSHFVLPFPKHGAKPASSKGKSFSSFRYALRRNPKLLRFTGLLPLILAFLLVMAVSTVQANYSSEYLRMIKEEYPLDLIGFNPSELEAFPYKDELRLYECYTASEGDVLAFHLLDEKDSVLRIQGMIEQGRFPKNDHEILVNDEFVSAHFGEDFSDREVIGKTIVFKGVEFTVCGITADTDSKEFEHNLIADVYYQMLRRSKNAQVIFIPYETLKTLGEKGESFWILGVYDGLYDNTPVRSALEKIMRDGTPNNFYNDIRESQQTLDRITSIFVIVLLISYITACIFMVTIVNTELFYRKKELGYLQIFGLEKKKITKLVLSEYFLKIGAALGGALTCYVIAISVYALATGVFLLFDPLFTVTVIAMLFAVYLLTACLCIRRFLKKSVLSLIVA